MTTITLDNNTEYRPVETSTISRLITECAVMTKRNIIHTFRVPDLLVGSTISPIMFVLLFRYVFGGAIQTGSISYVNFLMAGIFVQTITFGSTATGIGLSEDLKKGVIDRFRSLPMSPAAVLFGRTVADQFRNAISVTVMFIVGLLVGFRPEWNLVNLIAVPALILLYGFVLSWVSAIPGLYLKSTEAVQQVAFMLIMPLTFASSAFVPTSTMPSWLRAFAANQPLTQLTEACRSLLIGLPMGNHLVLSLVWAAGLFLMAVTVAVTRFAKLSG